MALTVKIGAVGSEVDLTSKLVSDSLRVQQRADTFVSTCSLRLIDEDATLAIKEKDSILVEDGATKYFAGTVANLDVENLAGGTESLVYTLECQDYNILVEEVTIPSLEQYSATLDSAIIDDLFDSYLPEINTHTSGGAPPGYVQSLHVFGEIEFVDITLREALDRIATEVESTALEGYWYIDPDKYLHYFNVEDNAPAWHLSDTPDEVNSFSYFSAVRKTRQGMNIVNRILVVGASISLFVQDQDSHDYYGKWFESIAQDTTLTTVADIMDRGRSLLARWAYPDETYEVRTHKAGLQAGMNLRFENTLFKTRTRTNQIKNPSFEVNVTDAWTFVQGGAGGSAAWSAAQASSGDRSCKIMASDAGNAEQRSDNISLADGETLTVQARLLRFGTPSSDIEIYDVTNGASRATTTPTLTTAEWDFLTVSWKNSTGGVINVQLRLRNKEADGASGIWFDSCLAEIDKGEYPVRYIDGTLPFCSWNGAAHNSTSYRSPVFTVKQLTITWPEDTVTFTLLLGGKVYPTALAQARHVTTAAAAAGVSDHDHTAIGDGGELTGAVTDSYQDFAEIAAPAMPAAVHIRLYVKADSHLYQKDDAGVEIDLTGGAGGLPVVAGAGYALVSDGVDSWAADQTPNWTGLHTFEAGITLGGASSANAIVVPDNVAQAMHILDDGGTPIEYLRIVSTDAQPVVVFNDGGVDVDFRVEGVSQPNALFVRGSDGYVGIGTTTLPSNLSISGTSNTTKTFTTTAGELMTAYIEMRANPSAAAGAATRTGLKVESYTDGTNALLNFRGLDTRIEVAGTGTITHLTTWNVRGRLTAAATVSGWTGLRVPAPEIDAGSITTFKAVWVNAVGATTNWAIYAESGDNYFADKVGVGTTPAAKLDIVGTVDDNSAYALDVSDSSGNSILYVRCDGRVVIGAEKLAARLDIYHSATGLTASRKVLNVDPTGTTFNTTVAALTGYGAYLINSSTRSAGANDLTNVALYLAAAGAQKNYALVLGGASSANAIVVPDNVAQAMHILDDGGTPIEYLRIVSTDAQPVVVFNDGGVDVDFRVEGVSQPNALFVRGSDGYVGIGMTPAAKLDVTGVVRAATMGDVSCPVPASGKGVEILYCEIWEDAGTILSYDRTASAYKELNIQGDPLNLREGGALAIKIDNSRVGILTAVPGQVLDVNAGSGNMIADGYDTHVSFRKYKENLAELEDILGRFKRLSVYQFTRIPYVSADELRDLAVAEFGEERFEQALGKDYRGGKLQMCPDVEMLTFLDVQADLLREERRSLPKWQRLHYGLILDDPSLLEAFPDLVSRGDDGNIEGYSLNNYVGILHGALKELVAKVEVLEAR